MFCCRTYETPVEVMGKLMLFTLFMFTFPIVTFFVFKWYLFEGKQTAVALLLTQFLCKMKFLLVIIMIATVVVYTN